MSERVTIARFYAAHEAQLAQMKLEAHGVHAVVLGALGSSMTGLYNAAPGVSLEVDASQAERARKILEDEEPTEGGTPYREPALADEHDEVHHGASEDERTWKEEAAVDAEAARAFRGAILGFFFCPGIMHAYVLWQLRKFEPRRASKKGKRQAKLARWISYAVFVAVPTLYFVRQAEVKAERAAACETCRRNTRQWATSTATLDRECSYFCDPR